MNAGRFFLDPAQARNRALARARKCFKLAREQMQEARRYRKLKHIRAMRAAVWCARENVRLGRKIRAEAPR